MHNPLDVITIGEAMAMFVATETGDLADADPVSGSSHAYAIFERQRKAARLTGNQRIKEGG